jgi:hypothetical protein
MTMALTRQERAPAAAAARAGREWVERELAIVAPRCATTAARIVDV